MLKKNSKIYVAGHNGMVGRALCRALTQRGYKDVHGQRRSELDLTDGRAVLSYFEKEKFDNIFLAAAKVGGIHANSTYPAEFIYQNLAIQNSVIESAFQCDIKSILFLGSSCIYPREAIQPMPESELLSGRLEPTNEPYALAKIAGIKMCDAYNRQYATDYRSVMPTNLYGPGDSYHQNNSHVIPALIQRLHNAKVSDQKSVTIWGTGSAKREFLHVDDLAHACLHVLQIQKESYNELLNGNSHINIGFGTDCSIKELVEILVEIVDYNGELRWDTTKPDGTPRKLLDSTLLLSTGWRPSIDLRDGLKFTYESYLSELESGDVRTD